MALRVNSEYREIAQRFIDKFPVAFAHIEINQVLFLSEDEKKPKKYADVRKVGFPYSSLMEYKFIFTFYDKVIEGMSSSQKNMLVYHELLHIDENFNKLKKHSIEDFVEIVASYGPLWDKDDSLPDILEEDELPQDTEA